MDLSRLAHALFPMVLQLVNLELAAGTSHETAVQQDLDTFLDAIRVLGARHDNTGLGVQLTTKCLEYFRSMRQASSADFKGVLPPSHDWTDMSIGQPASYLRLVAYLDLSMSQGRPAQATELSEYLPIPQSVELDTDVTVFSPGCPPPAGLDQSALSSILLPGELDGILSTWHDYGGDCGRESYAYEFTDFTY